MFFLVFFGDFVCVFVVVVVVVVFRSLKNELCISEGMLSRVGSNITNRKTKRTNLIMMMVPH